LRLYQICYDSANKAELSKCRSKPSSDETFKEIAARRLLLLSGGSKTLATRFNRRREALTELANVKHYRKKGKLDSEATLPKPSAFGISRDRSLVNTAIPVVVH